ncbi:MAG: hypothetical protein JW940_19335 [Polyangiaceae bacterium]|nr:hypothetical protein [Polyangiaceae bacterium]
MFRRTLAVAAACSAVWFVFGAKTVLAGMETAPSAQAQRQRVDIYVAGDAETIDRTRATAEELFGRLRMAVHVGPEDEARSDRIGAEPPLAVVHVDLSSPLEPRLLVVEGSSGSELARRALPATPSLETSVEEVIHIAYLMVESLLEHQAARTETQPPPAPEPEPAPTPPQPPIAPRPASVQQDQTPFGAGGVRDRGSAPREAVALGLDAGLALTITSLGADRILPGAGVVLETRLAKDRQSLGILGAGAVHTSSELVFADASSGVRPFVLRLLLTYDRPVYSTLSLVAGAGGGLDGYRIEPHRSAARVRTRTGGWALDPALSGALGVRARLVGSTLLTAAIALDVDLAPSRFVALSEAGSAKSILRAPRARPALWLALSTAVARSSGFPQPGARP